MSIRLTPREREVADLVAQGLTNREIAERLVVSERTAEGHVEQIRNKLGLHSRSQVAAWVAAQPARAATPPVPQTPRAVAARPRPAPASPPRAQRWPFARHAAPIAVVVVGALVVGALLWPREPTLAVVAGIGTDGFSGDGGPATYAQLSAPTSMAFDDGGALLFADSSSVVSAQGQIIGHTRIRRLDPGGTIRTVAGDGSFDPFTSSSGAALHLDSEVRLAFGPHGELYLSQGQASVGEASAQGSTSGHWVGRIGGDGQFSVVAGGVTPGYSGDGGRAARAQLAYPRGLAVAADGTVYVADSGNNAIRAITPDGQITSAAGNGTRGYGGDGGRAGKASLFAPLGVALSADGTIFISDTNNHVVRMIDHGGTITTVAGDGSQGYAGDGGAATKARLAVPSEIAFGRDGVLYIADSGNGRVRAVSASGTITTVAGPPTLARPTALAFSPDGVLYIGDSGTHRIYKLMR